MKKILLLAGISVFILTTSCNNNAESNTTHKHDDGSVHDHDTTIPTQQEFIVTDTVKKDTSSHSHENGKKHSH